MVDNRFVSYDVLQLRHSQILIYQVSEGKRSRKYARLSSYITTEQDESRRISNENLKGEKYTGKLTPTAKRNLARCIDLLLCISPNRKIFNKVSQQLQPFRISFITLTIPSDTECWQLEIYNKYLMKPFLQKLRDIYQLKDYVWKVELTKSETIHYHLTTNIFIDWNIIRDTWNYYLNRLQLLDSYHKEHKHINANSTDVHSVKNIKNLENYMLKYLLKATNGTRKLNGKIWGASQSLTNNKHFVTPINETNDNGITYMLQTQRAKINDSAFCSIIRFDKKYKHSDCLTAIQIKQAKAHIKNIRDVKF